MRVYEELICEDIGRYIIDHLKFCKEEFIEDGDTKAIEILEEIKKVLHSNLSDFEMIEKIVSIFKKNNIDCGSCHDFE